MTAPTLTRAVRDAAREQFRRELAVRLTAAHDAALRRVPDLYRRIVGEALLAENGQTGKAAQLRAAQRALDRVARIGVVDFVDQSGRRWNMQSYVEMAVRTAALRVMTDAQMRVYRERDVQAVYVTNVAGQCELCRPWEARILSIAPLDRGPLVADGRLVDATVADALAAGLQHPNCRHQFRAYIPGETEIPPATPDPEAYGAQQRLRTLERTVRHWRRRQAAAITPEVRATAARKIVHWQDEIRSHVAATGVRRLSGREQISRPLPSPTPLPPGAPTLPRPERIPDPPPRLTPLSDLPDDELDAAMQEALAADDMDAFDVFGAEADRRDETRRQREARNARARGRREQARQDKLEQQGEHLERLLAAGVDEEEAVAEAFGVPVEQQRRDRARRSLQADGYRGTWREMTRTAYRDRLREEFIAAEDATNGFLLSREGESRGLDSRRLFTAGEAFARRWASDELRQWWDQHGRLTYDAFIAEITGETGPGARGGDFLQ